MGKIVKILGTGCSKCQQMVSIVQEVIAEHQLEVKVEKVEDIVAIMELNVMTTPALVVDGVVVLKGRLPSKGEVLSFLK
jgi:small redox-active disulfide protein 2